MNRPGDDNVPDTAVAQTLHALGGIMPIALTCIGASAAVLVIALAAEAEDSALNSLLEAIIMTFLSYAVIRHFLSGGNAPPLAPIMMIREPGFRIFFQLELLATVFLVLMTRLGDWTGIGLIEVAGYVGLLLAYARYGTILPALVAGTDASLAAAQARNTTGVLMWRLIAAVALGFMMMASLILLPGTAMQQGMGVEAPTGLFVMAPFAAAISAFSSALVAVILSKAYQGRYTA